MKQVLLSLALALSATGAAAADKLSLQEISTYLNGMKSVQAGFTQSNDDGSRSKGAMYIKRPGRMRFEYSGKNAPKVIAANKAVYIIDPKSNQQPETYPLKKTPLSLILANNVDLTKGNTIVSHKFDGTATIVRAQDPKNPERGYIDLRFTDSPVRLTGWVVRDANGGSTGVTLGAIEPVALKNSVFNIQNLSPPPSANR